MVANTWLRMESLMRIFEGRKCLWNFAGARLDLIWFARQSDTTKKTSAHWRPWYNLSTIYQII